jgi:nucleolar protein 6
MPESQQKLTKKQKKGLAFRERKGKRKEVDIDVADLPVLEIQDDVVDEEPSVDDHAQAGEKRKRQPQLDELDKPKEAKEKKLKKDDATSADVGKTASEDADVASAKKTRKRPPKYILFVGVSLVRIDITSSTKG